jgi:curved DNA-binding protein CbpA
MMLPSQGLRPLDPYKTLQLHPHAPQQLIVAAYWSLVSRRKQQTTTTFAASESLNELNAAYGLLMDDEQRRTYDGEHGLTALERPTIRGALKRFAAIVFGTTASKVSRHPDYYHLLRIDREADAEIIALAHDVLSRQATNHVAEDVFLRDLRDDAYRTLSNPQLRAQYDASLEMKAPAAAPQRPAPPLAPPDNASEPAPNTDARMLVPADASKAPERLPVDARAHIEPPRPSVVIGDAATADDAAIPGIFRQDQDGSPHPVAGASPQPPEHPAVAPPAPAPADGAAPEDARAREAADVSTSASQPRGLLHRPMFGSHRAPAAPANGKHVQAEQLDAAKDRRLLTLRVQEASTAGPGPNTVAGPEDPAAFSVAELVFVAGPLIGEHVALGLHTITLGSSPLADVVLSGSEVAPEHARIWQQGEHFAFRQLEGADSEIGGQQLLIPLVMLDDGDEIGIGPHRMRFSSPHPGERT